MNKTNLMLMLLVLNLLCKNAFAVTCTVNSSGFNFGSFNVLTGDSVDSNSTITVSCDASVSYTIALSQGNSGIFSTRKMMSGSNILEYNLYTEATYQTIWGNDIGGSVIVLGSTSNTLPTNHTVYGRIPLNTQRGVVSGNYSDNITITVTY